MKPILYSSTATSFNNQGLGVLSDAVSCTVVEERNGEYELTLQYPVGGIHYSEIEDRAIIMAIPSPYRTPQPFRIYSIESPLNGIVTIHAHHISYDLSGIPVSPFTAGTCKAALSGLVTHSAVGNPFSADTDKLVTGNYTLKVPTSFRACLGGQEGSILDVYGKGEYEFDKFNIYLHLNRGSDNGVKFAYGVNITDFNMERNLESVVTGIYPYWANVDGDELVELDEKIIEIYDPSNPTYLLEAGGAYLTDSNGNYLTTQTPFSFHNVLPLDLSSEFEEAPTQEQLKERAEKYITDNGLGAPKVSIEVSFVHLSQTAEYSYLKEVEKCDLCDTVTVEFPLYGISVKAKIIAIETDVLLERYNSVQIGDPRSTIADTIAGLTLTSATKTEVQAGNQKAADVINNTKGTFEWIDNDADGRNEGFTIYESEGNAFLRCTAGGIGLSEDGGQTYTNAITKEGIVATAITVGEMSADRIRGGTLQLGGYNNVSGLAQIYDENEVLRIELNKDGITAQNTQSVSGSYYTFTSQLQMAQLRFYQDGSPLFALFPSYSQQSNVGYGTLGCYRPFYVVTGAGGSVGARYAAASGTTQDGQDFHAPWYFGDYMYVNGNFTVSGTKSRSVNTDDYGERLLYAYETPSPMFGDVGEGEIAEDGYAYILIEPMFAQTIQSDSYHVFITSYSEDDVKVVERTPTHFVCKGTQGTRFSWMLMAKQKGYEVERLEEIDSVNFHTPLENYGG